MGSLKLVYVNRSVLASRGKTDSDISHSDICNYFTKMICEWAEKRAIHITAAHIPGDKNTEVDRESRELSADLKWMLCSKSLSKALVSLNYTPKVNLFASNVNHQFHTYYSYKPDAEASVVDSSTAEWGSLRFYAFPAFLIIPKVLKIIKTENADGMFVVIFWLNQSWFPYIQKC